MLKISGFLEIETFWLSGYWKVLDKKLDSELSSLDKNLQIKQKLQKSADKRYYFIKLIEDTIFIITIHVSVRAFF